MRSQLVSQLNVENMLPKVGWTEEQLKEYLDKPPAGNGSFFIYVTFLTL